VTVAWGILSTAKITLEILQAAEQSDRAEVIAVASRDAARAEAYAREHGIARAYGKYEALLEDSEVEALYIPLPNSLHVPWTLRALEAGKHVLCEKPFSRRAKEIVRAFDLAESAGLVLSEGFMWRHHPQTGKLAQLVADGAIGPLRLVRAAFGFQLAASRGAGDTRFRPDLDGGALMDVGSYCVNGVRFLAGEPERVYGEQVVGESGVDVCFAATLRCPHDVVAHFDCGFVFDYRAELEAVGEAGSLFVGEPWQIRSPGIELRRDGEVEQIPVEPANSYGLELENVSAAIRGEAPLLLGRDDAVGQARVLEALYRSANAAPVEPEFTPVPSSHGSAS
jgi:D-xylose 1-dehydrogenase (NADP+, D-xylono-1,5-lactone-forming)